MSSFSQHEENIKNLAIMGFDVSDAIEDSEVTMESWGYDDLVYLMKEIIDKLQEHEFKVAK